MGFNYTQEDLSDHLGVGAVIKDASGRILMQEHVKFSMWTIPVGKAKPGQSIEEALKMELSEECGIQVTSFKELAFRTFTYPRDGKMVNVFFHLFEVLAFQGEIHNKEAHKHRQQVFLGLEEVMDKHVLSDGTLLYLETLGIKREKTR